MTLESFVSTLRKHGFAAGMAVERWPGSNHPSLSIVELRRDGARALSYIKLRNSSRGFWGLNPNQVRRMSDATLPWSVVLLHGSEDTGYFLTSAEVSSALGDVWRAGHDGEFKVNENTVANVTAQRSFEDLVKAVAASICAAVS